MAPAPRFAAAAIAPSSRQSRLRSNQRTAQGADYPNRDNRVRELVHPDFKTPRKPGDILHDGRTRADERRRAATSSFKVAAVCGPASREGRSGALQMEPGKWGSSRKRGTTCQCKCG